ncbi:MAG: long-chain fatty acid--CoA ligase [Actinomycetaceae bacterium]|nr:long-chain fatty acid--CoA ligase [Arcanobacterium sp.]MDD7504805.1 long-chain fatty acid--CoA ligase [Actinomycetaceae bacterium]MDY6142666.1 long-chain fatty acid--CoA ligase [Arcanobacterium sp.]
MSSQLHQVLHLGSLSADAREAFAHQWHNIGEAINDVAHRYSNRVGYRYPDENEHWQDVTWNEFRTQCYTAAAGLLKLGVQPGDVVTLSAGTSITWLYADFGLNMLGATTCAIYPNTSEADTDFIMSQTRSRTLIAGSALLLDKFLRSSLINSTLEHIVILDGIVPQTLLDDPRIITWDVLMAYGRQYNQARPHAVDEHIAQTSADTPASLIYTSGTSGQPKGVVLTQGNWIFETTAWAHGDLVRHSDTNYLWLPLSHVFGKLVVLLCMYKGAVTAIDGRVAQIVDNLAIVKPTILCGVPRIFEKIYAGTKVIGKEKNLKASTLNWAMRVGSKSFGYRATKKKMPAKLAAEYRLADKLVYSAVREKLGGRIRLLLSGSARLDPLIQRWFFNIGIPLVEGYGLTETTGAATFNDPDEIRFGTVGTPTPGTQIKIADDGEVLLRGPHLMGAYYNDPDSTAEVIKDGWFHTGDIGTIDDDGFLRITDRKKNVMKSSNGKYIYPSKIEGALTSFAPGISQAVVIGENRKYVSALIALDRGWVLQWCKLNRFEPDYDEALTRPELIATIQAEIDEINRDLSRWEQIKKFEILPRELSVDDGTETPTAKVRRAQVMDKYSGLVERMYEGAELWGPASPNFQ